MITLDPKKIEDLVTRLTDMLPESVDNTRVEVQKSIKSGFESVLQSLNVTTREEFDVQTQLLTRTRKRLNELQARLDALEAKEKEEKNDA